MKLHKTTLVVLAIAGWASVSSAQTITFAFKNASLELALHMYAEYTGKTVEVVQEVDAIITAGVRNVTLADAIAALEKELNAKNIGLFPIGGNRVVATWLDPSKAPAAAKEAIIKTNTNISPEVERRLRELRNELKQE